MDSTRIIQQGEVAKFLIEISDFDMTENDFSIELIYGYRRSSVEISKSDMITSGGSYYFSFDSSEMVGPVIARCTWYVPDTDIDGSVREKVEEQILCFVAATPCPQLIICSACECTGDVTYTRSESSSIADLYELLTDVYGRSILTTDGEYIYVLK